MARFGRDIVRQLTDPTMAQGMFELGRQIGGLPGERKKKKAEEQKKAALIDLENQLRQTAAAGVEAARTGQVGAIELQIKSINEQLKTEQDETKRQRLTDTYKLLSQNLSTARQVKGKAEARTRGLEVSDVARGGELSYEDGNLVGVMAARDEVRKRIATESNEEVQSQLLSTLETLNKQIDGISAKKADRNVKDLMKAETLYEQLEAKGSTRTDNESKVMAAVKQRIDQLREDPDTVRVVKEQKGAQRLAELTQQNQIQAAEEKRAIAILSSLDPKSEEYKREKQRLKDSNLGEAVKKVEKAAQEVETAQLNLEKLRADVRPTPLTEEQKALGEKYGASFQEGTSREIILANRKLLESTLSEVSKMGRELALRNMKPLDEPAARAFVSNMLYDLKEQKDLPFTKDFGVDDLEDKLRDLPEEEQEYLINAVSGQITEEAEQTVLDFLRSKYPKEFETTEIELDKIEKKQTAYQKAYDRIFVDNPSMDKNNPVDQAMAKMAVEEELKNIRTGKTIENVMQGALM